MKLLHSVASHTFFGDSSSSVSSGLTPAPCPPPWFLFQGRQDIGTEWGSLWDTDTCSHVLDLSVFHAFSLSQGRTKRVMALFPEFGVLSVGLTEMGM